MEPITLGLFIGSIFCIVTCPSLCIICISSSNKKNDYQIMES
mgnify:CR=1 FL=1